jgi:hypothetical protein
MALTKSIKIREVPNPSKVRQLLTGNNNALALAGKGAVACYMSLTVMEALKAFSRPTIAHTIETLPPLREGFVRLLHTCSEKAARRIERIGFRSSWEALYRTTHFFPNGEDARYYLTNLKISPEQKETRGEQYGWNYGNRAVVVDLPREEYDRYNARNNDRGFLFGLVIIPREYIIGNIDISQQLQAQTFRA